MLYVVTSCGPGLNKERPRAAASLEGELDELLTLFVVPEPPWRKVRATNIIERAFRWVRRRNPPMSSLTNPQNCDRIVCGLTRRLNRSWEAKPLTKFMQNTRRYRFAFCLDAGQGFVIS